MQGIRVVIQEAQDKGNLVGSVLKGSPEWCFLRSQPVTEFEWVAIFEREMPEYGLATPTSDTLPPQG